MSLASDVASVVVWPGLTSVIAYAFLSISTMNLTNGLASSLYEREPAGQKGGVGEDDLEFVHDSNDAQELRFKLANFPRRLWPTYVLFVVLELVYAAWLLMDDSRVDSSGESAWGWYGGIPLLAVAFTAFLVIWTARLNSKYYAVMDAIQQETSGDV